MTRGPRRSLPPVAASQLPYRYGLGYLADRRGQRAAIVGLWVYGKNISGVHGWGDLWTSIGRLTGLLSAYLALIQVLLLARLPWLERLLASTG